MRSWFGPAISVCASLAAIILGACSVAGQRVDCPGSLRWRALISSQLVRYPAMELPDVLKLLQQATLGNEHAMHDAGAAEAWMNREWASLDSGPPEPLVDTLGAGGQFVRIHLRPYRASGGTPGPLLKAFVATARHAHRDAAGSGCALAVLQDLALERRVPWPHDSVQSVIRRWANDGYPALDHSEAYVARYRPAYRVIAVDMVALLLYRSERRDK